MKRTYRTFRDFYPFYLSEHSNRTCRRLHFAGTSVGLVCLVSALLTRNAWWLLVGLVAGYAFAWVGHFVFEKNRPATFTYPLWSLRADFVMWSKIIQGTMDAEVERFHEMLGDLARHLEQGTPFTGTTPEQMLQGPFADAMTHAGQLAMLRRLAGVPVAPENFIVADIDSSRLGIDQAAPVSPDKEWPEAPAGWKARTAG